MIFSEEPFYSKRQFEIYHLLSNYQGCYIRVLAVLTNFILGPWIGMELISVPESNTPLKEMIILCLLVYVTGVFVALLSENLLTIGFWYFSYAVMVFGHWVIYYYNEVMMSSKFYMKNLQTI